MGLVLEGGPVASGSKVISDGVEIGEITSSAAMMVDGVSRSVALGYLRLKPQTKDGNGTLDKGVLVDGSAARVTELPFTF